MLAGVPFCQLPLLSRLQTRSRPQRIPEVYKLESLEDRDCDLETVTSAWLDGHSEENTNNPDTSASLAVAEEEASKER